MEIIDPYPKERDSYSLLGEIIFWFFTKLWHVKKRNMVWNVFKIAFYWWYMQWLLSFNVWPYLFPELNINHPLIKELN